jgi:hypothetical protein
MGPEATRRGYLGTPARRGGYLGTPGRERLASSASHRAR